MDDEKILDMFFDRNEDAIQETAQKYGNYCMTIANNILRNRQDAEECVNDTYLRAWNAIPPARPAVFRIFLAKIARNLALDKYKWCNAKKRNECETARLFSELDECIPGGMSADSSYEAAQAHTAINASLLSMSKEIRMVFMRRYFYGESIKEIATRYKMREGKIKTMLFRSRQKLKADLEKEEVFV